MQSDILFSVIARSEATKQSIGVGGSAGLLRFARNGGDINADRPFVRHANRVSLR
ncbi:MAG TPA: hypothetical protein VGA98_01140 [Allosphingosinicella sp.]|jgi:predicted nucleic acid-binding protein